jgi:HEAT repeat protein
MDNSFNLARHVARFMLLLMRQRDAVDQQKLELRAITLMTKESTLRLGTREGSLMANSLPIPAVFAGVQDLADQLIGHRIESIENQQGMTPGEFLAICRIIAEPIKEDPADVHRRLRELELKTITVQLREAESAAATVAEEAKQPEPAVGTPERIDFVLARANRGGDGQPVVPHFEEVAFAAEQAARLGEVSTLMHVFVRLIANEVEAHDPEVRRHFVLTLRRLTKPRLLQPIARIFVEDPGRAADAEAILTRCGTDGCDAIVDQFAKATTRAERETFVAALDKIPSADAALMAMLSDQRPHVMRVAAELLSLRTPHEADKALAEQLDAEEPRVRRAALRALGFFDTEFAVDAVARGLGDPIVEVRLEAVAALARRKGARVGDIIGRAIDDEDEVDVQVGMLSALGRIGTSEAVAKLAKAAEAAGIFAAKRGSTLRIAAVRALAEARTGNALSALKALANDKDRDVREAASRAINR